LGDRGRTTRAGVLDDDPRPARVNTHEARRFVLAATGAVSIQRLEPSVVTATLAPFIAETRPNWSAARRAESARTVAARL
jgi:hypothetical protein